MSAENDDQKPRPDDDKVGYCKPPKHSQFQPGQSGNSRGRPKKNRSLEDLLKRELDRIVRLHRCRSERHGAGQWPRR